MTDALADLDGVAQAELVRSGQVSPLELVDAAIARIEAVNPTLNAVIHGRFDQARAEAAAALADGGLRGVPMVVKDLDGMTAGDPYHEGSVHLRDAGLVGDHDSNLQARFMAAGMVILGRTNTPELGLLPTTEPLAHGPSRNPWDITRSTGGSSGGSAAAVASGMVAIGHAGDGGGSIRIPASACGLVGLMPSRGRTSVGPEQDEAWGGFVRRHVVTRSVRDSAAVLDAVHGWQPGDPYVAPTPARPFLTEVGVDPGRLRVGIVTASPSRWTDVHAECVAAVEAVGRWLEGAGHDVFAQDWLLGETDHAAMADGFATAYAAFAAEEVDQLEVLTGRPVTEATVEPTTWFMANTGRAITATSYLATMRRLSVLARRFAAWWTAGNDVLVTPTLTTPPPPLGWFSTDEPIEAFIRAGNLTVFTAPMNVTGQPAISLPLHTSAEGWPIGVQLVAAYGREDVLLRVAAQLESIRPWAGRRPAVHA